MAISTKTLLLNLKFSSNQAKKLKQKHKAYFLLTLADLLEEGFSIYQSLVFIKLLMKPQEHLIDEVMDALQSGLSFEKSIHFLGYSNEVVAQLFYAQKQGRFIQALRAAGLQIEKMHDYQQKIKRVLTYPLLMTVFLVAMMFGMRLLLLPHIMSFITQETFDSNILVRILIVFFNYLPQISMITAAVLLIGYLIFDFYYLNLSYLLRYQRLVRIPMIKHWVRSYCSYKIAKELGYFFEGGYSLLQTIEVLILYPIDPFLTEIAEKLKEGMTLGMPLTEILIELELFTIELPLIIYQGELTSQTAQKCKVYSEKLFVDLMQDVSKRIGYIQPILFLVIAIFVMAMYLTIMLPMLTMDF
ncbi:competence type IV pilus assembly protein ComGB [Fundicoccus ignavus]|uniref:Type II secretion system protein GspF domain-containing protein n=1 Tax=Fundicoccus ignavus TaxID=2664442 RepID=A0A844CF00_9LACT|nr:hypothetical protein [Fundicoccus ignavus]